MDYRIEDLFPIVGKLSEKYTGLTSTSVSYETAEQLLGAVLYCLREIAADKRIQKEEVDAANADNMALWPVYVRGYEMVLEKTARAKKIYDRILIDFQSYGNRCYEETVIKGMPEFFVKYDARFRPQDHLLTLDYPVLNPAGRRKGIDAIYFYLSCVVLEQRFLGCFPREYVVSVLSHYCETYEDLVINVCSVVMRNVMVHMMMGKRLSDHTMSDGQSEFFCRYVCNMEKEELEDAAGCCLTRLLEEKRVDKALLAYLSCDRKDFIAELRNAAENGCIERIAVY